MVFHPGEFRCLTFIFLDLRCTIHKDGPHDNEARMEWTSIITELRNLEFCETVHVGKDDRSTTYSTILFTHSPPTPDGIQYIGLQEVTRNIGTIARIVGRCNAVITAAPMIFNVVFDCHGFWSNFSPLGEQRMMLDLFRVQIRRDFESCPSSTNYTPDELRKIENPLQAQGFVKSLREPPETKYVSDRCPRGGHFTRRISAVKNCFCSISPATYAAEPKNGEEIEQFCITQWESRKAREKIRRKHPAWWRNTFETLIDQAEKSGDISDVEHWTIELEEWNGMREVPDEGNSISARIRGFVATVLGMKIKKIEITQNKTS